MECHWISISRSHSRISISLVSFQRKHRRHYLGGTHVERSIPPDPMNHEKCVRAIRLCSKFTPQWHVERSIPPKPYESHVRASLLCRKFTLKWHVQRSVPPDPMNHGKYLNLSFRFFYVIILYYNKNSFEANVENYWRFSIYEGYRNF